MDKGSGKKNSCGVKTLDGVHISACPIVFFGQTIKLKLESRAERKYPIRIVEKRAPRNPSHVFFGES